jgi:4-hydroxybenzoate polyprenyltransferase
MIKIEHTVFALPFAYLGMFLGSAGWPALGKFIWITLAMAGARTAAMSLNRVIDRHIDARNPRTAQRALPKGDLHHYEVYLYVLLSLLLLGFASYQLNKLAFALMPLAVFFLAFYSYTKRFTWLCHVFLGIAMGLAPLGAWIGVTGQWQLVSVLLGLGVVTWGGGFDIIYACQDVEFDRREGLYSIPAHFGVAKGLKISAGFHVISGILLMAVGLLAHLGILYYVGVLMAIYLLYRQHHLVRPDDLSQLEISFFNLNGYLSVLLFLFTALDCLWRYLL